ncbi:MAG TPA: hypothetical protein VGT06_04225 [Candidatus Methylomirabilis sp.]|nr:hypothetical protein [Candidatus Methylomirabilis sp.]
MSLSVEVCRQARTLIATRLGLDFPERRQADLERGLARAWRAAAVPAPEAYLAWLANLPDESPEWRRLASHLTVGETYFFRDRSCFEALEQQVLPPSSRPAVQRASCAFGSGAPGAPPGRSRTRLPSCWIACCPTAPSGL